MFARGELIHVSQSAIDHRVFHRLSGMCRSAPRAPARASSVAGPGFRLRCGSGLGEQAGSFPARRRASIETERYTNSKFQRAVSLESLGLAPIWACDYG